MGLIAKFLFNKRIRVRTHFKFLVSIKETLDLYLCFVTRMLHFLERFKVEF